MGQLRLVLAAGLTFGCTSSNFASGDSGRAPVAAPAPAPQPLAQHPAATHTSANASAHTGSINTGGSPGAYSVPAVVATATATDSAASASASATATGSAAGAGAGSSDNPNAGRGTGTLDCVCGLGSDQDGNAACSIYNASSPGGEPVQTPEGQIAQYGVADTALPESKCSSICGFTPTTTADALTGEQLFLKIRERMCATFKKL